MCEGKVNSPLHHVTLMEEAHNLLRRNNTNSAGGGDLKSASVEMISNAIAEMRTYGEGFIIADQSPSVLDLSVIRNTHTKVFFMLPDRNDREISGDSLTLTEPQKRELARLRVSFEAAKADGYRKYVMFLHYPPTNILEDDSGFTFMAEEYGAEQVIYAHSHGESRFHDSILGEKNGVQYSLASGDYLNWVPMRVL